MRRKSLLRNICTVNLTKLTVKYVLYKYLNYNNICASWLVISACILLYMKVFFSTSYIYIWVYIYIDSFRQTLCCCRLTVSASPGLHCALLTAYLSSLTIGRTTHFVNRSCIGLHRKSHSSCIIRRYIAKREYGVDKCFIYSNTQVCEYSRSFFIRIVSTVWDAGRVFVIL
jgi:hypothetical protein